MRTEDNAAFNLHPTHPEPSKSESLMILLFNPCEEKSSDETDKQRLLVGGGKSCALGTSSTGLSSPHSQVVEFRRNFWLLFVAAPAEYGTPPARNWIRATAATLASFTLLCWVKDWTHTSTATWAATVGFWTHCATGQLLKSFFLVWKKCHPEQSDEENEVQCALRCASQSNVG